MKGFTTKERGDIILYEVFRAAVRSHSMDQPDYFQASFNIFDGALGI